MAGRVIAPGAVVCVSRKGWYQVFFGIRPGSSREGSISPVSFNRSFWLVPLSPRPVAHRPPDVPDPPDVPEPPQPARHLSPNPGMARHSFQ